MNGRTVTWHHLITGPLWKSMLYMMMQSVARGLSDMVGRTISNDAPRVETIPIAQVATRAGDPEMEVVSVYLNIEGDLRGRAILILPLSSALKLVDLLMDAPPGTTTSAGLVEQSALAEVGNLTVSYFLNAVAAFTKIPKQLRPSPPFVVVDALGAVLELIAMPMAGLSEDLLIIETAFRDVKGTVQARFWVLPHPADVRKVRRTSRRITYV